MTGLRIRPVRLNSIHFHEFGEHSLGKILETDKFTVYAEALGPPFSKVGYRIMQKDLKGPRRRQTRWQQVPYPLLGSGQNDKMSPWEDGTKIIAADYISAPRPGKIITIRRYQSTDASVRLGVNAMSRP